MIDSNAFIVLIFLQTDFSEMEMSQRRIDIVKKKWTEEQSHKL